ncbi:tetratricopeptide repeat protein [Terrimonas sp. NA20]|uniref:histidine kinase n=1 Tax=Terrimonas ginsenosidimutans TaxID=2908004 RepID=A0ABS9KLZ5_9BACT|nr:sensor histidine kinase [Terrimonas ginsenosidimutans]MCG2613347.1 tetratricopeptide repeat protein [Terrimonas ginsenosidimutans]
MSDKPFITTTFMRIVTLFSLLILLYCKAGAQSMEDLELELKNVKDSAQAGKIISRMGNAWFQQGNFVKASECFFRSLRIAEKFNDQPTIATNINNLSATFMETENYADAEKYALRSISLYEKTTDHRGLANSYNSLANVYYMLEKDSLSLSYFERALAQRRLAKDTVGLFKGYKNLGAIHFEMGDTLEGIRYLEESINFISNPSDSALWFSAYLGLAQIYGRIHDLKNARLYFDKAGVYVKTSPDYTKLEDYYYSLSEYYRDIGDFSSALAMHVKYVVYRDSVVNQEKNGQLAELNIRYETDKKQQMIQAQEFEIARKNYWLTGGAIFLLLAGGVAYLLYRNVQYRRVRKLQEEIFRQKELAAEALFEGEQNERIRIARDLHDSIGQQLSAVKMKLNAMPAGQAVDDASGFLDGAIKEVRHISHNLLPESLQFGWVSALEEMCEKMTVKGGPQITLSVDDYSRQYIFSKQQELSIYRIIQEIISNTVKHAEASNIHISISGNDNSFFINTSDDGKGMDTSLVARSSGIGWKNIAARVNMLRGKMDISSQQMNGTKISIAIPLQ